MDKLVFLLSEGLKNLWRHKLTVFSSVFSIFLSLATIGILFIAEQNTHKLIEYMRTKYKIEVFFQDDIGDEQAREYVNQIGSIDGVYSTTLIGKDEALKIYRSQFDDDISEFLGYNPLPISCVVNVQRKHEGRLDIMNIVKSIEQLEGIDTINKTNNILSII